MDTVATAKELLTNPQIWPWLILAAAVVTLQSAATKWADQHLGKISTKAIIGFGWRLLVFLLVIHAILTAGSSLWCVLFTSEPSTLLPPHPGASSLPKMIIGYGITAVVGATPLMCAAAWNRATKREDANWYDVALFRFLTKCLVVALVLSFVFWSINVPGSASNISSVKSVSDAAIWYTRVAEFIMTLGPLVAIPSLIVKVLWHLSGKL